MALIFGVKKSRKTTGLSRFFNAAAVINKMAFEDVIDYSLVDDGYLNDGDTDDVHHRDGDNVYYGDDGDVHYGDDDNGYYGYDDDVYYNYGEDVDVHDGDDNNV